MISTTHSRHLLAIALVALAGAVRAAAPAASAEEDTYDLRQVLLRQASVTVTPGQWQLDTALTYARAPLALADGESTLRMTTFANTLRLGITDQLEVFGGLPLAYASRETTDATGFHDDTVSGVGDVGLGLSTVVARESASFPGTVFTLAVSLPTGESPYDGEQLYGAYTGSGHTSVRGEFDFVRSSDPIVLYWGLGYEYFDSADGWGLDIEPGSAIHYRFGLGFSVNRDASLVAELQGAYQFDTSVDGETIDGSVSEPVAMKFGVTTRLARNLYVEPAVAFGITDDAPDMVAGATLISRGAF